MSEHPDEDSSGRTIVIHLTRDNLMLIGALLFLLLTISLALLFPARGASSSAPAAVAAPAVISRPAVAADAPAVASRPAVVAPTRVVASAPAVATAVPAAPAFSPSRAAVSAVTSGAPSQTGGAAKITSAAAQPIGQGAASTGAAKPALQPQARPAAGAPAAPAPARAAAVKVLRGTTRWSTGQLLRSDYRIAAGATLIVEPGVEVRLARGISLIVEGTLQALGAPDRPVRFVGVGGERWESIVGAAGSTIQLQNAEVHNGGAGGKLLVVNSGNLIVNYVQMTDNWGQIRTTNSRVDIRNSTFAGNDIPYGAAIETLYTRGSPPRNNLVLNDSRLTGNRLGEGSVTLQVSNERADETIAVDIQRNLLDGQSGPDVTLFANGQIQGSLVCNTLIGGANGLSVRSNQPQTFSLALNIGANAIEGHSPPLDPFYRKNKIGRGATSEIPLGMSGNWWGSPSGPYAPDRHADGRGDAVSSMVVFDGWLAERPGCAPRP